MNLNITKENARFIVNPEKRKVVCIIEDTRDLFINFVEKNLPIKTYCRSMWGDKHFEKQLLMPNRFIGIATCDITDEWNEETGKLIAFSRAKDNLHKSFFKRANTYINNIDDWLTEAVERINTYGDKITRNTERRHNRIAALLGEEE